MRYPSKRPLIGGLVVLIVTLSCSLGAGNQGQGPEATPTESPRPPTETPTQSQAATALPADTSQPQVTTVPPTDAPTETPGAECSVLQSLNLRSGPGIAYNPPLRALPEGTRLRPIGFNPVGIPGGPWAQVEDPANNQIGWVSAGTQFISCNIDLTTLPSVAVAPPPPPPPPRAQNSDPDGSFPDDLIFRADFDSRYLLRLFAYDQDTGETTDGAGITAVIFSVEDADGREVYSTSEETPGFCIFGGGEPDCNAWPLEDYVYKWQPGGIRVENGVYTLNVRVVMDDGQEGNWRYQLTIVIP